MLRREHRRRVGGLPGGGGGAGGVGLVRQRPPGGCVPGAGGRQRRRVRRVVRRPRSHGSGGGGGPDGPAALGPARRSDLVVRGGGGDGGGRRHAACDGVCAAAAGAGVCDGHVAVPDWSSVPVHGLRARRGGVQPPEVAVDRRVGDLSTRELGVRALFLQAPVDRVVLALEGVLLRLGRGARAGSRRGALAELLARRGGGESAPRDARARPHRRLPGASRRLPHRAAVEVPRHPQRRQLQAVPQGDGRLGCQLGQRRREEEPGLAPQPADGGPPAPQRSPRQPR
mmetsp:Transcript_5628/g.10750  ORF Transcript_5628/g.10750 Transcript_5628/m.10750 type:complete len:284 (-) Transcript_5628:1688-2539(-)